MPKMPKEIVKNKIESLLGGIDKSQNHVKDIQEILLSGMLKQGYIQVEVSEMLKTSLVEIDDHGLEDWQDEQLPLHDHETQNYLLRLVYLSIIDNFYQDLYEIIMHYRNEMR